MFVFLGTPITSILHQSNVEDRKSDLSKIKYLFESLNAVDGFDVFCALDREQWGNNTMNGDICTKLDYLEMVKCDLYITFPIESHGVSVELGWSSAMKKRTIILLNESLQILTPLHLGLHKITDVEIIKYKSNTKFPDLNDWNSNILPKILKISFDRKEGIK